MFSRTFSRAAAPFRQGIRGYASQGSTGGGSSTLLWTSVGVAALGGGYWYYSTTQGSAGGAASPITAAASKPAFTGGDQGFLSLKLEDAEILSHNTKRFRFHLPETNQTSGLPVASALLFKYKGPEMEKAVLRPYTPTSDENEKGYIEFVIKKYPGGPMTEHLHDMKPGQRLDIKGPLPKYPYKANEHDEVVMIAGGTGITPMYQVMRKIFSTPEDKTKVTLLYGNQTEDDILLKKELNDLENTYPQRFRAFYTLDKPPKEWSQGKGHINKDLLKTTLPEPASSLKVFVCGPPGLYKAISGTKVSPQDQGELDGLLKELGYKKDQVYKF